MNLTLVWNLHLFCIKSTEKIFNFIFTDFFCSALVIPISFAIFTNILCNFKTLTFVIQLQIILFRNNKFYLHFVCNLPQTFAVYPGLKMWWLGSHQLLPRKVAASDWARTCNLRLGDWRSSLCRYGASLTMCPF